MQKKSFYKKIIFFFVVTAVLSFVFLQTDSIQKKFFYPLLYSELINTYAQKNNIKPWLVASIIKNESGFKAGVVSRYGAVGIMQIMPDTALWIAKQIGYDDFDIKNLSEPRVNIRLGSWYISELYHEFNDETIAVAAYNAGRGQVRQWLETKEWDGKDFDKIPFVETREYVKRVIKDKENYKNLYKDIW